MALSVSVSLIIYTLFALLLGRLVVWWIQNERRFSKLPGPPGLPILGNALDVMKDNIGACDKWAKEYGPVYKYKFFFWYIVVVAGADAMRHILVTHESRYSKNHVLNTMLRDLLGDTLLTITDPHVHRQQRAVIAEAFSYKNIKLYYPVFIEKARLLAQKWDACASSGEPVDIAIDMDCLGVDIIGRIAFASEFNALGKSEKNGNKTQGERLHDLLVTAFLSIGTDAKMFIPFVRNFSSTYKKQLAATKMITEEMKGILNQKRQSAASVTAAPVAASNKNKEADIGVGSRDLLDILLTLTDENGEPLSDESIIDQCKLFLLAGQETSATAMTWMFYLLASYPDVQDTLYKEVMSLNDEEDGAGASGVDGLKYLGDFIKESMRHRSPVVMVMRKCEEDDEIGDCVVPAGAIIYPSPWTAHHFPGNWTKANEFDPSRWASSAAGANEDDNGGNVQLSSSPSSPSPSSISSSNSSSTSAIIKPGAYMPFMMGSRNCIGNRLALLEMKSIVTFLVRRYEFSLPEGHPKEVNYVCQPTLKPSPKVHLLLKRRK
eukprot:TRINITY_DN1213_c0_g1_i4.p1 TRINITY_DN1213_c0_g1~~TRINITY_DN1213_c0_g1_i4.p1  ORF type:complete len:548 (+),score=106.50 TRINITY_DN1213_c0_g1_i4:82-1725(+)